MAFSLLCPIIDASTEIDIDSLEQGLREYFQGIQGWSLDFDDDPFDDDSRHLVLRWPDWWIMFFVESGDEVLSDAQEMAQCATEESRGAIASSGRRIRVVFADDDHRLYTNETIYTMEFLEALEGVRVFDPQRGEFMD
ncbi:MAG: hypothetical protein ACOY82_11750 [Pseudomonadota bacterium]